MQDPDMKTGQHMRSFPLKEPMNRPLQTNIKHSRHRILLIVGVIYAVFFLVMTPSVFAVTPVADLFSSGSGYHITPDISLFGVVGQSSPLGTAQASDGTRLLSGNLVSAGGIGASSALDSDGDGTPDIEDHMPNDPTESQDNDGDGIGDNADPDDDNDGTPDTEDAFPYDDGEDMDTDEDGTGNNTDTDDDNDGISDLEEEGGPNNGDGNSDSLPDSLQRNVTALRAYTSQVYVILESAPGTTLTQCEATENPSPDDAPANVGFVLDFFNFTISGVGAGPTTLTLYLPAGATPDTYYKYGQTPDNATDHWYEFLFDGDTGAEITANVITLTFIDAERGDDVLVSDSLIIDLGGPGYLVPDNSDGDGGGGSGGCFIESLYHD
jgi:hypothetical protein